MPEREAFIGGAKGLGESPEKPKFRDDDQLGKGDLGEAVEHHVARSKPEQEERGTSLEKARELMGGDFLGPEAYEKAFGFSLEGEHVPDVEFSPKELEAAKARGEMLILQVDKGGAEGKSEPLDVYVMQSAFENRHPDKKLFCYEWALKADEPAFHETARAGWRLVSKEPIPGSITKDCFDQTMVLYDYLVDAGVLPEAADEREKLQAEVADIRDSYRREKDTSPEAIKEASRRLAELPVNAKYRRRLAEQIQAVALANVSGPNLLPREHDVGCSFDSERGMYSVGYTDDARGALISKISPASTFYNIGVCASHGASR